MFVITSLIIMLFLSLTFFLLCYLGTGTDAKNLKHLDSYPQVVIDQVLQDKELKTKVNLKESKWYVTFLANFLLFGVILFLLGLINKPDGFLKNFLSILIIGEGLNLFDFLIIDLCWWRHSKRIRFTNYPDKAMYLSCEKHFYAFLRGAACFFLVALVDGLLLQLF